MDEIDECAPAGLNALHKAQVQTSRSGQLPVQET